MGGRSTWTLATMQPIRALFLLGGFIAVGTSDLAVEPPVFAKFLTRIRAERPTIKWDAKSEVTGNFEGNGRADFAVLGYEGKGVVVAIGRTSKTGDILSQYLNFAVSGASQAAICTLPARLELYPLVCSDDGGGGAIQLCVPALRVQLANAAPTAVFSDRG